MNYLKFAMTAVLMSALASFPVFGAEESATTYPAHTIANSQLRVLPRTAAGRHYQLHISLPGSYAKETNKRYPVVYVTDAYWDFAKIDAIRGSLFYDKYVPEFIVVGLGYAGENPDYDNLRLWELSPAPMNGDPVNTGHAADFLKTVETQIIPYIDREFRTDPSQRVLAGASLGGLFTLYTMYTKPGLFNGYICASPAVIVGDNWLLNYEAEFVKAGRQAKGRLFVAVGENEWPNFVNAIFRYNQRVQSRKHPDLAYKFHIIDGARHSGMQFESYVRGLSFVFAPLAPESGPLPEF